MPAVPLHRRPGDLRGAGSQVARAPVPVLAIPSGRAPGTGRSVVEAGRRHARALACAGLALLLAGCGEGPRLGMPEPISDDGEEILGLWRGSFLAAATVGALVWGLIIWAAIRYRRRNDDLPSQTPENIPLELLYTAVPLLVVLVLFGFTVVTQERVTALSDDPDVVVDVTAFQWSWTFGYPDEGVEVRSDGVSPPELAVPVGATVRFELDTVDVAHNFWVPELLTKRDILPDVENAIDVEIDEAGSWTGRCAEFCGLEHHDMLFTFTALQPEAYDAWLEERRAAGDVLGPVEEEDVNEGVDG